jgi:diguanylate cyclase (GGDEF)-like protein
MNSNVDPVTGIPTWPHFVDEVESAFASANPASGVDALVLVDIDRYRQINITYGYRCADAVLQAVAQRLVALCEPADLLARRASSEFVLLMRGLRAPEEAIARVNDLLERVAEDIEISGRRVSATVSAGLACYKRDGDSLDALLAAATAAIELAKGSGGNTYSLHSHQAARRIEISRSLQAHVDAGLIRPPFSIALQPVASLDTHQLRALDVFLRWTDERLGAVTPFELITIADQAGLTFTLSRWLAEHAAQFGSEATTLLGSVPALSIHLSPRQLRVPRHLDDVIAIFADNRLGPGQVQFQIGETTALRNSSDFIKQIGHLSKRGYEFTIDDFGMGHTSLALMKSLPVSALKIDRYYVFDCMRDARSLTITKAIVDVARMLGIETIAGGVDSESQVSWLLHIGCRYGQGEVFGAPMSADQMLLHLLSSSKLRERSLLTPSRI